MPICDDTGGATFSPNRIHRYLLWRRWAPGPLATWIMLNPSSADEVELDPTIRRCVGFSRMWGCGGLDVVNLFALRSTDPKRLKNHADPVGPDNDDAIVKAAKSSIIVVAAWGMHGGFRQRADAVRQLLAEAGVHLQCLGITKGGEPLHPLYLASDSQLKEYAP